MSGYADGQAAKVVKAIKDKNEENKKQNIVMIWLTVVIVILTLAIFALTFFMARESLPFFN